MNYPVTEIKPAHRFQGYMISLWSTEHGAQWHAWISTPRDIHIFCKGSTFQEVKALAVAQIALDVESHPLVMEEGAQTK